MSVWCNRTLVISPLYFGLCTSEKMFHKELKKLGVPGNTWPLFISNVWNGATTHFFESDKGKTCALVCIRDVEGVTGIEMAALLVHEAVHIWQAIKENYGETNPSDEFEAYSIQHISGQLMDAYHEQKEKK